MTGGSGDTVTIDGQSRHVSGYLRDFLFPPERLNAPVSMLSGGERNRLLLARLFAKPSNLLIMDEPTNDLDAETLELLEEMVADYAGTLLLVSHDREFLDNVVTSTLVFEGAGRINEYVGGYSDWLRQRRVRRDRRATRRRRSAPSRWSARRGALAALKARRLSYNEQRELAQLPGKIQHLEAEQVQLHDADQRSASCSSATRIKAAGAAAPASAAEELDARLCALGSAGSSGANYDGSTLAARPSPPADRWDSATRARGVGDDQGGSLFAAQLL